MSENMDKLHALTDALMKYETIDSKQVDAIMAGEEPGAPTDWWDDSEVIEAKKEAEKEDLQTSSKDQDDSDTLH